MASSFCSGFSSRLGWPQCVLVTISPFALGCRHVCAAETLHAGNDQARQSSGNVIPYGSEAARDKLADVDKKNMHRKAQFFPWSRVAKASLRLLIAVRNWSKAPDRRSMHSFDLGGTLAEVTDCLLQGA